ncbi:hypothetical protein HCN44_008460 [Aphidius gifuensis]|uniref:RING-type E3 ubiquitin transferase n=1 Tax=Aphidius gifuensis TaxID=684658 RepID=A0A834XN61_APHGI|nr:hypothetical protein HCN44_008460 [Aphidius gifuensis]
MSEERETSSNTSSINNNDDNNNNNNNNNNGTCVVCYKNVEIYSIGMCEHPVCYECSTRMRVLCRQNECPICRQDLPKVVFIKKIKPFRDIIKGNLLDTRYNIFFDNTYIQEKFTRLLSHICPICKGNKKLFGAFTGLKDHMRREHDLHYCDLCVDNLKIFTNERRCYTRFDLGLHRRKGDKDDKSHRGHPLCEFCECRYMDNDELFRHLRRDHLFCHFCDADGLHQYYNSYDYLRDHFSKEHYLCEEGPCADEKFTSVFRSDIDLKAHKSSVHSKFMGKAAAKQARTLELEFTLAPRGDNNRNNRRGHQQSNNNNQTLSSPSSSSYNSRNNNTRDYYDTTDGDSSYLHESEMPSASSMKQPDVQSTQEFPSLGNAAAAASSSSTTTGPVNFSHTKSKGGRGALGSSDNGSNSGLSNIVNLNVYSSSSSSGGGSSSNNNNNNNITKNNNNNNNNNKTSSSVIQTSSSPNVSIQLLNYQKKLMIFQHLVVIVHQLKIQHIQQHKIQDNGQK